MKPTIALLMLYFLLSVNKLSAQGWNSGHIFTTSNGGSVMSGVTTDKSGNVYASAWFFSDYITFGSITLAGNYNYDYCALVKYSPSGSVLWATASTSGESYPISSACDNSGNVVMLGLCGSFFSWQSFPILDSAYYNYFLAKFDSSGTLLWLKKSVTMAGNPSAPINGAITVDNAGNIYITGGLIDSITNVDGHMLANEGGADIFVLKYDPSGDLIWAKSAGGNKDDLGYGIATTQSCNFYLTGNFASDSIMFDSVKLLNNGGTGGSTAVFIAKYDSSGHLLWARSPLGSGDQLGVATDLAENAYMVGTSSYLQFDSSNYFYGYGATYVARYNADGTVGWLHHIDSTWIAGSQSITVDLCNNVWIASTMGYWGGDTVLFDDHSTLPPPTNSVYPVFIAEYTPSGTLEEKAALQYSIDPPSICADRHRNIYLGSSFQVTYPGPNYFQMGADIFSVPVSYANGYVAKYIPSYMGWDTIYSHTDTALCSAGTMTIAAPPGYLAYEWNDCYWNSTHSITDTTTRWVYCFPETCSSPVLADTFIVIIDTMHTFSLGSDTSSCIPFCIYAPYTAGTYLWQNSSTADSCYATASGTYVLTETTGACTFTDSVAVIIDSTPCETPMMLVPSAFTPNNDGNNDIIRPIFASNAPINDYLFVVIDKWGDVLFSTNDLSKAWDGNFKSTKVDIGTYMYRISYKTIDNRIHYATGNITLIR